MTKNMTKKKKPVLRTLLIALAILAILAIIALALAPQFLAKQATQAPADTHTFVTRQIENTDLSQRMQSAVNNAAPERPDIQNPQNPQNIQANIENTEQPDSQNNTGFTPPDQSSVNSAQLPPNQNASQQTNPDNTLNTNTNTGTFNSPSTNSNPTQPTRQTQSTMAQNPPQSQNDVPQQRTKSFEFQISQNEISSMIYSGLVNGTAPAFRQSIQGVSTQITGGRAKISVALLPKYLPDAFLRNLPGITRSTPTVYLGGEMGLSVSGNTVEPRIYRVSLGNMGVPMPFIENAVRGQVQAYVRNATRLPNGQQAQLQNVRLEGGAIHIQGRVD